MASIGKTTIHESESGLAEGLTRSEFQHGTSLCPAGVSGQAGDPPRRAGSFAPLALLAMRETGADGYVLEAYENDAGPVRLSTCGVTVPAGKQEGLSVARFALRVQNREAGSLAFVFRAPAVPAQAWRTLERVARTLESIWCLYVPPDRAIDLVTGIARQQAELADLKIADRAHGFLHHPEPGAGETMALHVECVLSARRFEAMLEQFSRDLEEQIEERRVITQAKNLLEATQGFTEDEAHAQLRLSSRRSRRRLVEVARQLIEGRAALELTQRQAARQPIRGHLAQQLTKRQDDSRSR
jgi:ANTAR domain